MSLEKYNAVGADIIDAVIIWAESIPNDVYAANTVPEHMKLI